ncbi:multimeric flavodoxin WrbA [Bacteroides sp. CAG:462]|nr:multimeric flavodoxin WrbA [Bacteroides sp. CAG:462]
MKVLLINGSPHREGNTFIALPEVARVPETPPHGSSGRQTLNLKRTLRNPKTSHETTNRKG